MRTRSLTALSTVAVATLLLAGCSSSEKPEASPSPKASTQCQLDAQPGKASDAVKVDGTGDKAKVTVPKDTEFSEVERTVLSEGDGDDVQLGDLLSVRYQIVNPENGEVLDSSARGDDGVLPVLLDAQTGSLFVAALECEPVGSRVVLALPAAVMGEGGSNIVVYAESLEALPTVATGKDVEPVKGMPTVKLAKDGEPTITMPKDDAPADTQIEVLKQGDGKTVGEGDLVAVQYRGVKWSNGEEFDSTWSNGMATQFQTTGVVPGFKKALEGQKVGSQVLAVIPPKDGYGTTPGHALEKETIVFVVDIIATTPMS